jgi:hypothetical protein
MYLTTAFSQALGSARSSGHPSRRCTASYPFFVLFNMAGALAKNIPSILVFRLLAGSFGSAPLTNAGGQIGDMWAA